MQVSQNKLIIITGGAGLLGEFLCHYFGSKGNRIVLIDKDPEKLKRTLFTINEAGISAKGFIVDITKENLLKQTATDILKGGKTPDILINLSGLQILKDDLPENEWKTEAEILLKGNRNAIKVFSDYMENGCIINFTPFPVTTSNSMTLLYKSLKTGVLSLAAAWARETTKSRNRILTLVPGFFEEIETHRTSESITLLKEKIPTGKLGNFKSIASTINFITSAEGSYLNGSAIYLDGGYFS